MKGECEIGRQRGESGRGRDGERGEEEEKESKREVTRGEGR